MSKPLATEPHIRIGASRRRRHETILHCHWHWHCCTATKRCNKQEGIGPAMPWPCETTRDHVVVLSESKHTRIKIIETIKADAILYQCAWMGKEGVSRQMESHCIYQCPGDPFESFLFPLFLPPRSRTEWHRSTSADRDRSILPNRDNCSVVRIHKRTSMQSKNVPILGASFFVSVNGSLIMDTSMQPTPLACPKNRLMCCWVDP